MYIHTWKTSKHIGDWKKQAVEQYMFIVWYIDVQNIRNQNIE